MNGHFSWPGGLTHHQDAFGPLSRMLLAPYAAVALFGGSADELREWLPAVMQGLQRCAELLTQQQLQPLLGNTLYQVQPESLLPARLQDVPERCLRLTPAPELRVPMHVQVRMVHVHVGPGALAN